MGPEAGVVHPDFDNPWCKSIFAEPDLERIQLNHNEKHDNEGRNSMFEYTLYSERGIRAHVSFRRPCKEPDAVHPQEDCFLLSLGDGLDGVAGRAHGGLNALILDHLSGHAAHYGSSNPIPPATATMFTDYKAPVSTPCVVLARAWAVEVSGRKVWVKAVLEDSNKRVCAVAKCLFIAAKPQKL